MSIHASWGGIGKDDSDPTDLPPFVYHGDWPDQDDPRGGWIDLASPVGSDQWVRLIVTEIRGGCGEATLDRSQVARLHCQLGEWLDGVRR